VARRGSDAMTAKNFEVADAMTAMHVEAVQP
jgi:hypothetical protein